MTLIMNSNLQGENFTIKCFSKPNYKHNIKYTYNWTKNKELLPVKTETEQYEVLHPMGSILQVSNINVRIRKEN